jgi:hypothetical protein
MISHLPFGYVPHYILSKQFDFRTLRHKFKHNFTFLIIVNRVVFVVADLLQEEPVSRRETHIHVVVSEGVCKETVLEVPSEDLDNRTYHLSNLVVQESLTFKEEVNELHSVRVFCVGYLIGLLINVHVRVSLKFEHVADGLSLMGPDLF